MLIVPRARIEIACINAMGQLRNRPKLSFYRVLSLCDKLDVTVAALPLLRLLCTLTRPHFLSTVILRSPQMNTLPTVKCLTQNKLTCS